MKEFMDTSAERIKEEALYREREAFLKENYPLEESHYEMEDLLGSGLDGKEVVEKRDDSGEIEGFSTYEIAQDGEGVSYCSLGIALTREESRGEGVMRELFLETKKIAEEKGCEYIVGIADTLGGEGFLLDNDFYAETDKITGREHFRLDLE